jgi:MoaA/NifB/PqqE/SkfB family radical SAM enzyme
MLLCYRVSMIARSRTPVAAVHMAFWFSVIARGVRGLFAPFKLAHGRLSDVNIEPTNLCNADCVFCGYQFQQRPHVAMEIDLAAKIITAAKLSGVTRLGLTPIVGEPLVHRKLEDFIRLARAEPNPLEVGLVTNGILLTSSRFRSLVEAGITALYISMSYPDEEEYRRIYRSPKLKTVVANIEQILSLYDRTDCAMTLSLRTNRFKNWDAHPLIERAREKGWNVSRNLQFDNWSGRVSALLEAEGLITRPNRPKILPCAITNSGPHFLSDGRATACGCRDLDGKSELALSPSDLIADMRHVYEVGAVATLRQRFRDGRPPDVCVSCRHYNPAYEGEAIRTRIQQVLADARASLSR